MKSTGGDDEKSPFKAFVGIDFGTDGSGLAYGLPDGTAYIHNMWDDTTASKKPKTSVLFDDKNNVLRVGSEAQDMYLKCTGDQGWKLFERFKMNLYEEPTSKSQLKSAQSKMEFVELKEKISTTNNKAVQEDSSKVFVAELMYLRKQAFNFIDTHLKKKLSLQGSKTDGWPQIQYFLTAPAIWSDKAKDRMSAWAKEAGLISGNVPNQLRIVYEPDCASLSIQHAILRNMTNKNAQEHSDNGNTQNDNGKKKGKKKKKSKKKLAPLQPQIDIDVSVKKGDKYILLDVGGGTCDVACHEVMGEFSIAEILHPSGGKWGATYIDQRFIKLLGELFTPDLLDIFQMAEEDGRTSYLSFLAHFLNEAKLSFYEEDDSERSRYHDIEMPSTFVTFVTTQYNKDFNEGNDSLGVDRILTDLNVRLEKVGKKYKKPEKVAPAAQPGVNNPTLIEDEEGGDNDAEDEPKRDWMIKIIDSDEGEDEDYEEDYLLSMHNDVWEMLFNSVIDPIIAHCKQILQKHEMKDAKYIFMVGGFANSKYFQMRMKYAFRNYKNLSIILPGLPGLCVVDGAARYGLDKKFVKVRRLAKSYGIGSNFPKRNVDLKRLPSGYEKKHTFFDSARNMDYIADCFSVFVNKNQAIKIGDKPMTKTIYKRDKYQTSAYIPIYASRNSAAMVLTQCEKLGEITVPLSKYTDNGVMVEFSFSSNLLTVHAYPKEKRDKMVKCKVEYY